MNPAAPVTTIRLGMVFTFLSIDFEDAFDGARCRFAIDHVGKDDAPPIRFDDFSSADIMGPITTFHQNLGENLGNQLLGLLFVEDNNVVHGPKRAEDVSTVLFGINGAVRAFVSAN